ncbi:sugar phosphate isomerase/epimerase family protein [Streptomyces sp. SP18CS02]|uniref:sugar phosphate isomerase/epimerase family protein n=1 Tax=Streptomyces sp. SP18CS02 TaxID=3002531 RepID=UPI002E767FAD|nr:sugar phosphate isomerase/epimerase family protein [Streptomyces sp. SP18CS02]MEE1752747.1 sugar phosphate isomerase/epimerase [Streptomyces sp. SP18CS02]
MESTLLVQPRIARIAEYAKFSKEIGAGFELIEPSYPDHLDNLDAYLEEIHRWVPPSAVQAVHGPFLDIVLHSPDPAIREVSERRVRESLDFCERAGARFLLLHSNHLPLIREHDYDEIWLQRNAEFLSGLEPRLRAAGITLVMENMWDADPRLLVRLVRAVSSPSVALCLDVAHQRVHGSGGLRSWWETAGSLTPYVQYGDNSGAADEDLALGEGTVDWPTLDACLRGTAHAPVVMAGVGFDAGTAKLRRSLDFLEDNGFFPFPAAPGKHSRT